MTMRPELGHLQIDNYYNPAGASDREHESRFLFVSARTNKRHHRHPLPRLVCTLSVSSISVLKWLRTTPTFVRILFR
jgi:hypothetical protein